MLSYARDIKPLFTEFDRNAMLFAFDLWQVEDVQLHAALILARLERGDMPCDAAWSPDRIATFRSWLEGGCAA
jgi:hypothetical protein